MNFSNNTNLKQRFTWLRNLTINNLISAFLLIQIYFICNLLSFGFWKTGIAFFAYAITYFGLIILALTIILLLYLKIANYVKLSRTTAFILVILTLPIFGIWIQTLDFQDRWLEYVFLLLFPFVVLAYFRLFALRKSGTVIVLSVLCFISFLGHAPFILSNQVSESLPLHPNMKFASISLSKKPNIHVIMFDSLTTSWFSKEFLETENPATDYLSNLHDSVYAGKMGFSENVPTRRAWGTLFGLGIKMHEYSRPFAGTHSSPLTSLLRKNGYKIQTGYSDIYLGHIKGPHVDDYYVGGFLIARHPMCSQKLLGFCTRISSSIYAKFDDKLNLNPWPRLPNQSWAENIIYLIQRIESSVDTPIFSAFHLYSPGHTPFYYIHENKDMYDEYRNHFITETIYVREILAKLNSLRLEFPDSIFIVSGDHGPYLFRSQVDAANPHIRVLDRHHVALALLNEHNLCTQSREWLEKQKYLTASRLLVASLACDSESLKMFEIFSDNEDFIKYGNSLSIVN